MYTPILKKIWEQSQSNPAIQAILENTDFALLEARALWQKLLLFEETDSFFLEYANGSNHTAVLDKNTLSDNPNRAVFASLVEAWAGVFVQIGAKNSPIADKTGKKTTTVRLRSLSTTATGCLSAQFSLRTRKNLHRLIGKYRYTNAAVSPDTIFLENMLAYLDAPEKVLPIFEPADRQGIMEHIFGIMEYSDNLLEQKCAELAQKIGISPLAPENTNLLLVGALYSPDASRIWAVSPLEEFAQATQTVAEPLPIYAPRAQTAFGKYPLNQIFYGVAGTGKTYKAIQIAQDISQLDPDRQAFVSFHPSFFYEDFVEGIRPFTQHGSLSYRVESGIFKQICEKAAHTPDKDFVLVIDELNRGNIPQIFGELISLIEPDKRGALSVLLPYSKTRFSVPPNLYLIGTMNSSDKSISHLDIALRRRFWFEEIPPQSHLLSEKRIPNAENLRLDLLLDTINARLEALLDRNALIGQAYFLQVQTLKDLNLLFEKQLIPLLESLFLGDIAQIGQVLSPDFIQARPNPFRSDAKIYQIRPFTAYFPTEKEYLTVNSEQ